MAWVTTIGPAARQVDYRLTQEAGCGLSHGPDGGPARAPDGGVEDARVDYRLPVSSGLEWFGSGVRAFGLEPGQALTPEHYDTARALMAGRDPHTSAALVKAVLRVDPRAKIIAAPLAGALERAAARRGVSVADLLDTKELRERALRLLRGVRKKGEAHLVAVVDADAIARSAGIRLDRFYDTAELKVARYWTGSMVSIRNQGYDLNLNVSKSVSVFYALGGDLAAGIDATLSEAARETTGWLEERLAYGVRGSNSDGRRVSRIDGEGLIGWIVPHRIARPVDGQTPDPHVHFHVIIANLVRGEDGKYSAVALGGSDIHRHAKAANAFFQARVRHLLTTRFGVAWERDARTGAWEITGIGEELRQVFSKRHGQLAAALAEAGFVLPDRRRTGDEAPVGAVRVASPQRQNLAASRTREAKSAPARTGVVELQGSWEAQAREHGVDPDALRAAITAGSRVPAPAPSVEEVLARVFDPEVGLTAHRKTASRVQVLAEVMNTFPGGLASADPAERMTDAVLARDAVVVPVPTEATALSNSARVTTFDILDAERSALASVRARYDTGVAVLGEHAVAMALSAFEAGRGYPLAAEQREVLVRFLRAGHGVDAARGVAGSGKTTILEALQRAYAAHGMVVAGASTAAVAALNLQAETGIPSKTTAAWCRSILSPTGRGLAGVDALVVDEAAMGDDRQLAVLLGGAADTGTKVIVVGDDLQLKSVGVGGLFKAIHEQVGGLELRDNRRQADPVDRAILATWRTGNRTEAVHAWAATGRLHVAETPEQSLAAMVADWTKARRPFAGDAHRELASVLVMAGTNADVDALNDAMRTVRRSLGELSGQDVLYRRPGGRSIALAVGDHVRIRANDYRSRKSTTASDILNGFRGVVTAIDSRRNVEVEWTASGPDGLVRRREWVGPAYIAAGGLTHGSAVTVASAQGLTCVRSLVYGLGLDAHTVYPGMTRHRQRADLYLPLRAIETTVERALHGPVRNGAHALQRAAAAYARTLADDRPDELLTPAPEPLPRTRATESAPRRDWAAEPLPRSVSELGEPAPSGSEPAHGAPESPMSAVSDAAFTAALQAEAERVAHQSYIASVARTDRPYGLLPDAELQQQITTTAHAAEELADQVAAEAAAAQLRAERSAAHHQQASADLTAEREHLAEQLQRITAAESAQARVETAEAKVRRITEAADQRAARLAERYDGLLKQFKISPTRTRMQNELERAESALAAAHTAAAQARRWHAAALQAAPDPEHWQPIRARHAELADKRRFGEAVRAEAAARLRREFGDPVPGSPAARVRAANLRSSGVARGRLTETRATLAWLTAERDHRERLSPAARRGEDAARRDPAAARHLQALREAEQADKAQKERARRQRERQTAYSPPSPRLGDSARYRGPSL